MRKVHRAEIIGGLIRPEYLQRARELRAKEDQNGERPSISGYKRLEDRAVNEAIALQETAGVDVVNDGEQRRNSLLQRWIDGIDGMSPIPSPPFQMRGTAGTKEWRWPMTVTGKLRRRLPQALEEFVYTRARASKPIKITLPSPLLLAAFYAPSLSTDAYPDPFELFADGVEVLRQECRELAAAGCEYIQIDCPELTMAADPHVQNNFLAPRNIRTDRFLSEGIALLNRIADLPGVTFGMHICRGGGGAKMHFAEGGYESISQQVFRNATNFDVFLLEYDDWRSGSFEPLKDVPTDKVVALGLVSNNEAPTGETPAALRARVEDASAFFPKENLAISSRCGFGGCPSQEMQAAKLQLIAEVAHSVWPQ